MHSLQLFIIVVLPTRNILFIPFSFSFIRYRDTAGSCGDIHLQSVLSCAISGRSKLTPVHKVTNTWHEALLRVCSPRAVRTRVLCCVAISQADTQSQPCLPLLSVNYDEPNVAVLCSFQHAIEAVSAGVRPIGDTSYNSSYWDLGSAFFFAGTVITTIGKT